MENKATTKSLYDARAKAIWAYTFDRSNKTLYDKVVAADTALVDHIAANRKDREHPPLTLHIDGKTYELQSYRSGTARYVPSEHLIRHDVVCIPVSKRDIVVREISVMRQINEDIQTLIDSGIDPPNDD